MKNSLCLLLLILSFQFSYAQDQKEVVISGTVIDSDVNAPLEYATIAFFSKKLNKIVTGGMTDAKGDFKIPVPIGTYDISVEYLSYKTKTYYDKSILKKANLGTVGLTLDVESLAEVEIIAERTTVEIKLDKKIYNVGKDLTVSGGTVSDVLDNVPSVAVDVEGNVSLRGNDNVRILINGKPSGLVGLNSTDALRQLPAESIERVEVITSPSARYDAEGSAGILNIILRRSKLQGLNGAITTNVGHPTAAGISGNINYRTGDFNFFNTTGYGYRSGPGHSYVNTRYFNNDFDENGVLINDDPDTFSEETNDFDRSRKGINTNLGVEWYINDSASLTTSAFYREGEHEHNTSNRLLQLDENEVLINTSTRFDPELEEFKTVQFSSNFTKDFKTHGHKLSLDFQYEDSNEDETSTVLANNTVSEQVESLEDETRILLQTDYVLPIGENSQFELGYRGNFRDKSTDYNVEILNESTNSFEVNTDLSNVFNYREYLNAAYSQYGSKINKLSFLLGLRLENTQLTLDQPTSGDFKKKNYSGLFPTVNLNYELSEKENMTLGYSRRIRRPRSWFINPFPSRSSLTNIFQGNPDLDPSYSGIFDLGYLNRFGKVTLSTSIYFQHATDVFNFISFDTGDTVNINGQDVAVIQRTPINLATNDRYGYELNLTYSPSKKWRVNGDFNFFKSITKGDYNGINFDADNISWSARLSNKYTLPAKIDWQTTLSYRGPSENAQNKYKGVFSANMAFSKDLFKEKASIAFNVRDVFNSRKRESETLTNTYSNNGEFQWRERSFNLSFTYRFNQKKKRERGNRGQGGGDFDFQG
ncbi:TonB-dependent receptor [Flavobacteriales bacterium 34_180_T64]|nr:TonB-dependent receptor [Flavobacteriales bacterium 34_180_T64]